MFNDIVCLSRETFTPNIIRYLIANPSAGEAIRVAAKQNLPGKKVLNIF